MKKIIICFILAAMLLFTVIPYAASAASGTTVSIEPKAATVCPGGTVTLSVKIQGNTGFASFYLKPIIPAGFTIDNIQAGSVIDNTDGIFSFDPNYKTNGNSATNFMNILGNINGDGELFTITLSVGESVTGPISFEFANPTVSAGAINLSPVDFVADPGSVNVAHSPEADDGNCTTSVNCTGCGQEIIPARADHEDANNDGKCDYCDQPVNIPTPPACAHPQTTSRFVVISLPTCGQGGLGFSMTTCTACGYTISSMPVNMPATGEHVDDNNDGVCDVCKTVITAEHVHELVHTDAKAATCTEDGNVEYWYCEGCDSYFTDAEGKNKVDAADVVVPAAHKVEHVAAKEATETEDGNVEYWHCPECGGVWLDAECTTAAKLEDVVIPATGHVHNLVYTAAKEATCFEEGNLEYWYCEGCDCYFTDAEGKYNIARLSLMTPVAHEIVHVEAKEATCFEEGNIEHWYCTKCGYAWLDEFCTKNTNLKAVILPVSHKVEHVEAKAPTCFEEGNIEYWYCTECGYAWLDELCIKNTNLLAVILPVSHNIVHVEAKAPTEKENGNIEYWYCTECGYAWLDELCTKNTNLKAVILPATGAEINPPTGDATILYIAAVAVIATLGVAVIRFKKREEN